MPQHQVAYKSGILSGLMAQPRAHRDGALGILMAQPRAYRDGALGSLMAQPLAFRDGALGCTSCTKSTGSYTHTLGILDAMDGTTKLLLGLGLGAAAVWFLKK